MPHHLYPIENGKYYHIYNRGINGETLFREKTNYEYFFRLYEKYVDPVADTYAWCMMPNHFHLLIRFREKEEISDSPRPDRFQKPVRSGGGKKPHQYFSNLFNAYTKAYNKRYYRHGALFERPFRRIEITHEKYFRNMVFYIHNNPVKHGFVEDMVEYPWSSYLTMVSVKPTKIERESVLGWFDSKNNFKLFHQEKHEEKEIEKFIIE
jgi:REP element-mobilizing transposase RayT